MAAELTVMEGSTPLVPAPLAQFSVVELKARVAKIQEVMRALMIEGVHYGTIPGTQKPGLWQPGAQLLGLTFRLTPRYLVTRTSLENGHREYEIKTTLIAVGTDEIWGEGLGSCSTLESKYRYRRQGAGKVENPDIADLYNTCLKIGKKRSYVDAILNATAASDIFDQDLDDERDADEDATPTPARPPAPPQKPEKGGTISVQQIGFLMATCHQLGVSEDQLKTYLAQTHDIHSRKDIPRATFDEILSWVKAQQEAR